MKDVSQNIENIWIPMPDGRRLAARGWFPQDGGPHPAILEYLPYRKRDATALRDASTHGYFADHGYACLRVDIAGTGDSEGQFDDEYSEQELSDGESVLAWMADQKWCDGNIGMIGISWGGFNGLQLAWRQPPSLKAVVSVASTTDRYADDIHYMGGCLLTDNANWSATMFGYLSRPADPEFRSDWREDWIKRMEELPHLSAEWLRHPTRDDFWKHGSVCEDWSRIKSPVLAITGWADAYVNAPPALAANLDVPAKALIGPWEHRYAHMSLLDPADFHGEVLCWFDRWLKGVENGAENLPDYRTFMQEHYGPSRQNKIRQGRWIAEADWPSPNVTDRRLHLNDGVLSSQVGAGQAIVSNAADLGQDAGYFCPGMRVDNEHPGDQAQDDASSTCFDKMLDAPLELLGRPRLRLAFRVDRPVAQIVARLCDVDPSGVSQRITYRPFNLTHISGHETPQALEPGTTYVAEFDLNTCAHRLRAGHRLRLALSTSYWPIVWPSPNPVVIEVDQADSQFIMPVRQAAQEITPHQPGPARPETIPFFDELRAPSAQSSTHKIDDGTVTLSTSDDFGQHQIPGHGMLLSGKVRMRYAIHPDDPTSASQFTAWNFALQRGDWQVEIDTENTMTCDAENFFLHRKLRATEGADKTEVLTKEWSETIPRGFL